MRGFTMSIDELTKEITRYQNELKLPDDYLFNIVEFTPAEVTAYRNKQAALTVYQAVLKQVKRLYLLSLSPAQLLAKLTTIKQVNQLSETTWLAEMNVNVADLPDFKAGKKPTMVYVTALNALTKKYNRK